ncbi:MAG: TonB-dependent receptor domain-containing protein, partial [Planctomycetota bacterium]
GFFDNEHDAPGGLTPSEYRADRFANSRPMNHFDGYRSMVDVVGHRDLSGGDWVEGFIQLSETARRLEAQRPHFGAPATLSEWEDESIFATVGARGGFDWRLGDMKHEVYAGARVHFEWLPSWTMHSKPYPGGGPRTKTLDAEYEMQTYSLHVDDTFRPAEDWMVRVGARLEWVPVADGDDKLGGNDSSHDHMDVLPGVDVSYRLNDHWALFANAHESFRAPQVWGYDFTGNDQDLEFETGRSIEAGVRTRDVGGLSGSLAAWWVDFDDVGVFYSGFYENLGRIRADGVDVVARWDAGVLSESLAGASLHGSWTHQDSELRDGPNSGNETPYAWENKYVLGARYARDGWVAALDGTYIGSSFSDEANTSRENATGNIGKNSASFMWDARVSHVAEVREGVSAEFAVGVTNLFDSREFVHSRGGFFGGGRVAYAPRQWFFTIGLTVDL